METGVAQLETSEAKTVIPVTTPEIYQYLLKELARIGYTFAIPIRSISVKDILREDRMHGYSDRLEYAAFSKEMEKAVTPGMMIALNPHQIVIAGTNNCDLPTQQRMARDQLIKVRTQLPQSLSRYIDIQMVDPSTVLQIEEAYLREKGEILLPNFFIRTKVPMPELLEPKDATAIVGRYKLSPGLRIEGVSPYEKRPNLFALNTIILPINPSLALK